MKARTLKRLRKELSEFLDEFTRPMGRSDRRGWALMYVRGLLLDGARKSVEPMAARLRAVDSSDRDYEQSLQQFVNQSPWDTRAVRDMLAAFVVAQAAPDGALIIDDTGFPKQGRHSVGVARQYSGTLGKVGNCQIGVTLQYADGQDVFCLDAQLYLPQSWTDDRSRCQAAGVPDEVNYQPKWKQALEMVERAGGHGFTGIVLADSAFGTVTKFRSQLSAAGWTWCVGVDSTLKVIAADADLGEVPEYSGTGRPPSRPRRVRAGAKSSSVREWATGRVKSFRKVTWREGTREKLSGRFAAWRVRPAHRLSAGKEPQPECWLLVEWPADADAPAKYFLSNLPPNTSLKRLVHTAKDRWWVEHSYRQLKGELGLDHFEGRTWTGWHHHVTLVMLAYLFLVMHRRKKEGGST